MRLTHKCRRSSEIVSSYQYFATMSEGSKGFRLRVRVESSQVPKGFAVQSSGSTFQSDPLPQWHLEVKIRPSAIERGPSTVARARRVGARGRDLARGESCALFFSHPAQLTQLGLPHFSRATGVKTMGVVGFVVPSPRAGRARRRAERRGGRARAWRSRGGRARPARGAGATTVTR